MFPLIQANYYSPPEDLSQAGALSFPRRRSTVRPGSLSRRSIASTASLSRRSTVTAASRHSTASTTPLISMANGFTISENRTADDSDSPDTNKSASKPLGRAAKEGLQRLKKTISHSSLRPSTPSTPKSLAQLSSIPEQWRPDLTAPPGSLLPLGNTITIEGPASRSSTDSVATRLTRALPRCLPRHHQANMITGSTFPETLTRPGLQQRRAVKLYGSHPSQRNDDESEQQTPPHTDGQAQLTPETGNQLELVTPPPRPGLTSVLDSRQDLRSDATPPTPTPHTAPLLSSDRFSPSPLAGTFPKRPRAASNEQLDGITSFRSVDFPLRDRVRLEMPADWEVNNGTITSPDGYTYVQSGWTPTLPDTAEETPTEYIPRSPEQIEESVLSNVTKTLNAQSRLANNKHYFLGKKRQKDLEAALVQLGSEVYRRCSITGGIVPRDTETMGGPNEIVRLMLKHGLEYDDVQLAIREWYVHQDEQREQDQKKAARRAFLNKALELVKSPATTASPGSPRLPMSPSTFDRNALYGSPQLSPRSPLVDIDHGDQQEAEYFGLGIQATGSTTSDTDTDTDPFTTKLPKPKPVSAFFPDGYDELNSYLENNKYGFVPRKSTIGVPASADLESMYSFDDSASGSTFVSGNQVGFGPYHRDTCKDLNDVEISGRRDSVVSSTLRTMSLASSPTETSITSDVDNKEDWETTDGSTNGDSRPSYESEGEDQPTPHASPALLPKHHSVYTIDSRASTPSTKTSIADNSPSKRTITPRDHEFDDAIGIWADKTFPADEDQHTSPFDDTHATNFNPFVLPPLEFTKTRYRLDSATIPSPLRIPIRSSSAPLEKVTTSPAPCEGKRASSGSYGVEVDDEEHK